MVLSGINGLWVGMLSVKNNKTEQYDDKVFPITAEARKELFEIILEAYNKKLSESSDKTIENVDEKSIPF